MPEPTPREHQQSRQLIVGELIACECAAGLAARMPTRQMRRAYERQARDEARHAEVLTLRLKGRFGPAATAHAPEFDPYAALIRDALADGRLVQAVLALNLFLEGFSAAGFGASALYVGARGDDPAWVDLMAGLERDERRHVRLLQPALGALGSAASVQLVTAAYAEVRHVALLTLDAAAAAFDLWGMDSHALFEDAIKRAHPGFTASYVHP